MLWLLNVRRAHSKASVQAREAALLDTLFSLCRHNKYTEIEQVRARTHMLRCWLRLTRASRAPHAPQMVTDPDWMLPVDAKDAAGNTLLLVAAQNNSKRVLKLCLRRGANINYQNVRAARRLHAHVRPLHVAHARRS